MRIALPDPGFTPFPPYSPDLLTSEKRRSYTYNPGYIGEAGGRNRIELSINNLGMRDDDVTPGEPIDVLAVGDSFTAGYMISADEAWPARLEHHLQKQSNGVQRVLNGGVSGYSIRQIRFAAEDYLSLKPDVVVAGAYLKGANRLFSPYVMFNGYSLREHTLPFLKMTDQGFLKAIDTPVAAVETQFWMMENFKLGAWILLEMAPLIEKPLELPVYDSVEHEMAEYAEELQKLKAATDNAGAELIVMLVTQQEPSGEFSERSKKYNEVISAYCKTNGIRVYNPTPAFEAYPEEGPVFRVGGFNFHWSQLGNDLAAEGLATLILETGLIQPD